MSLLLVLTGVEAFLPLFKSALETKPNQEQYWLSYADALMKLDRLDDVDKLLMQGINAGLEELSSAKTILLIFNAKIAVNNYDFC